MRKIPKWLLVALCIAWMIFIWQFSFAPATESATDSAGVREAVNEFLGKIGISFRFTPHTVRKTAHFAEFFVLGVLSFFTAWVWHLPKPYLTALALPVLTAAVDETIQCFVPGRGPALSDVLLDVLGGAAGIAAALLCLLVIFTIRARKSTRETAQKDE